MKRFLLLITFIAGNAAGLMAQQAPQDSIWVKETQIPVLLDWQDNVLFYIRIDARQRNAFTGLNVQFSPETPIDQIESVILYYGGTEGIQHRNTMRFAPTEYISVALKKANPSYSIPVQTSEAARQITFQTSYPLFPGINYFWVGLRMKPDAGIHTKVEAALSALTLDGTSLPVTTVSPTGIVHRMARAVRSAGDDGVAAFRIPGLATTNNGTLLAVYDQRHNSSKDLQEHIEIGLSRSTDGGQTWLPMQTILSMADYGTLPKSQSGVGDPAILVDTHTNTAWAVAWWTYGMGITGGWNNSQSGMTPERTGQLVMAKSSDNGATWSAPINITDQVKEAHWPLMLQGPGRGITMTDGTLVFACQFKDPDNIPHAGIMYSRDQGKTWVRTNPARSNTTEAQVAQLPNGDLMLNMRDNRGGSRAVAVTSDLGVTWHEHPSSRQALREPVCMASLISIKAQDNVLGRDLLVFSNPDSDKTRHHTTIKVSLDNGLTWPDAYQIMLDEGGNWGYSCLTQIDEQTVGILYESSVAHLTFQAVRLTDLVK